MTTNILDICDDNIEKILEYMEPVDCTQFLENIFNVRSIKLSDDIYNRIYKKFSPHPIVISYNLFFQKFYNFHYKDYILKKILVYNIKKKLIILDDNFGEINKKNFSKLSKLNEYKNSLLNGDKKFVEENLEIIQNITKEIYSLEFEISVVKYNMTGLSWTLTYNDINIYEDKKYTDDMS